MNVYFDHGEYVSIMSNITLTYTADGYSRIFNDTDLGNDMNGVPSKYLWIPYTVLTLILILLLLASFLHFHMKLKRRRMERMAILEKLNRQRRSTIPIPSSSNQHRIWARKSGKVHVERPHIRVMDYSVNKNPMRHTSLMSAALARTGSSKS